LSAAPTWTGSARSSAKSGRQRVPATANDADAFSKETLLEMLSHIDDVVEKTAALLGWERA
jgi:hypothetical protein